MNLTKPHKSSSLIFYKMYADLIESPVAQLFNHSLEINEIPSIWNPAVLCLSQVDDPVSLDNHWYILTLSVVAKAFE